jgi:hypothetical protein
VRCRVSTLWRRGNAFNSAFRWATYNAHISEGFSDLLPFWHLFYNQPNDLVYRTTTDPSGYRVFSSQEGGQQGDPYAVFAYCLTIHRVILGLFGAGALFAKSVLFLGYSDDVLFLFPIILRDLPAAFTALIKGLAAVGSVAQASKCMFYVPNNHRHRQLSDLGLVRNDAGFLCLGAPFASSTPAGILFVTKAFANVTATARLRIAALAPLRAHPQFSLPLLRSCISTGFSHLLRTYDFGPTILSAAAAFDAAILDGFFGILDISPSQLTAPELHCVTSQIHLPLRMSGLGLRAMTDVAACSYITMFNTHQALVSTRLADYGLLPTPAFSAPYEAAIRHLSARGGQFEAATLRAAPCQHALTALVDDSLLCGLLTYLLRLPKAEAPPDFQASMSARLLSLCASAGKHGSASRGASQLSYGWLTVRPVLSGAHAFGPGSFRCCLLFRLGLPPCWAAAIANATTCRGGVCSAALDRAWHHYLACPSSAGARTALHDALNLLFADWCRKAKVSVSVDPRGTVLFCDRRPGDTILRGQLDWLGSGGTCDVALFLDFVIAHPCAASHIKKGSDRFAGSAALSQERVKRSRFKACLPSIPEAAAYRPMAAETYGLGGASMLNTLYGVARQIVARTPATMGLDDKAAKSATKAVLRSFCTDFSCCLNKNLYSLFLKRSFAGTAAGGAAPAAPAG